MCPEIIEWSSHVKEITMSGQAAPEIPVRTGLITRIKTTGKNKFISADYSGTHIGNYA